MQNLTVTPQELGPRYTEAVQMRERFSQFGHVMTLAMHVCDDFYRLGVCDYAELDAMLAKGWKVINWQADANR